MLRGEVHRNRVGAVRCVVGSGLPVLLIAVPAVDARRVSAKHAVNMRASLAALFSDPFQVQAVWELQGECGRAALFWIGWWQTRILLGGSDCAGIFFQVVSCPEFSSGSKAESKPKDSIVAKYESTSDFSQSSC